MQAHSLEVIRYHQQVMSADTEAFLERSEELAEKSRDLAGLNNWLGHINGGPIVSPSPVEFTSPRIGSKLINTAFGEARTPSGEELLGYIGHNLLPLSGAVINKLPQAEAKFSHRTTITSCPDAEGFFVDCLRQLAHPHIAGSQSEVSVYHNDEGLPLALRKRFEVSSALTLQPIKLGEMVVPSGTIVGIGVETAAELSGRRRSTHTMWSTYRVEDNLAISPARLSPWAFDKSLDRAMYAVKDFYKPEKGYDKRRGRLVEAHNIDHFRKAATKIMAMCGIC